MLVLGRENGPQLPDHCQDVPELELGHARNERPAGFAPEPIPVALPRRLEYRCRVLRGPLQLANQLAPNLLRALPGRVLIVPRIARLPTRKQGTAMSLWY